jgi:hypothetical protein
MIYAILDKLKSSEELSALLGATEDNTKIYPLNANKDDIPCLAYNDSPVSDEGRLKENRLEIRAIDNDYDHLQEVIKTVSGILIISENQPGYKFNDVSIMSCSQNGGGHVEDIENSIYEKFIYLNIEWRYV